jgi:peptidoglycan/xylan/chitin deacetylase (PgdA/CDA1 family)
MDLLLHVHGRRDEPKVALTFDDGPNPPRTDEVLNVLAKAQVRATFFVVGKWVCAFPEALERIVQADHVVGNHSYEHNRALCDFDRAESAIAAITGHATCFVRAPYFYHAALARWPPAHLPGRRVIAADVNPTDYAQPAPEDVVGAVLGHPSLRAGSIIVLHDGCEEPTKQLSRPLPMVRALPAIIDGLRRRGLNPVGLDEMTLIPSPPAPPPPRERGDVRYVIVPGSPSSSPSVARTAPAHGGAGLQVSEGGVGGKGDAATSTDQ